VPVEDLIQQLMKRILLLLVMVACVAPAWAQSSALTIPRNLDQLTARSADIVRGTVISARVEKHPEFSGLDTVVVKLQVKETLKGQASGVFTFRQYVWDIRDRKYAAGYQKGQDLLLMMIAPSQYGLSSPAGLEQGRFVISREENGREVAVNGRGNMKLFDGVSSQVAAKGIALSPRTSSLVQRHVGGPVELRDLTALIRELAQAGQ
jgi:hypothetical protein